MRKLWYLEVEKIWEKIIDGISQSFFLKTNGGNWRDLKRMGRRAKLSKIKVTFQPSPRVVSVCHTWPERGSGRVAHVVHTWPPCLAFGRANSLTHLSRSSAVFRHPNSYFESVFRLWIVTPSRMMMTMKLWQMVENSSRKMTTNTTQRMRTKSSVATSFGLET